MLDTPYEKQLKQKQTFVEQLFEPLLDEQTHVCPIAAMKHPFYYRNKVTSPYARGKKLPGYRPSGKINIAPKKKHDTKHKAPRYEILTGMYASGTHRIIATDDCVIENKTAKRVIAAIKSIMQRYAMQPYHEDSGTGFIRHAVVRVGHTSHEVMVTIVTNEASFPSSRNFCRELVKRVPEITTIIQNINTHQTNVILNTEEKTLYGPGFILDTLCGLSFRISSHSFYQVNSLQTEVLYRLAIQMAQLSGTETVLDAYCGTGTIGLVAANGLPECPDEHAQEVYGVDNVASAIKDARNNALHNGIHNAHFITEDAGTFMQHQAHQKHHIDVVFMDPPRAGASEEFLEALCVLRPQRIVYISCNPKTQKRDCAYLAKQGYQLVRIQPIDMFPHTPHVETIALLTQENATKS